MYLKISLTILWRMLTNFPELSFFQCLSLLNISFFDCADMTPLGQEIWFQMYCCLISFHCLIIVEWWMRYRYKIWAQDIYSWKPWNDKDPKCDNTKNVTKLWEQMISKRLGHESTRQECRVPVILLLWHQVLYFINQILDLIFSWKHFFFLFNYVSTL